MAPFSAHGGSCVGHANVVVPMDYAAAGACQRHCWETIQSLPAGAFGRCVAYSVSVAAHESRMCSIWDAFGFSGPGGDGNLFRTCHTVALPPSTD